jgi:hypothetical protein
MEINENFKSIQNDLKSYELELIKNDIFMLREYRDLRHFYVFTSSADEIRKAKNIKRFNDRNDIDYQRSKVDSLIKKLVNLKNHLE